MDRSACCEQRAQKSRKELIKEEVIAPKLKEEIKK
jgi:hypothetical protein